MFYGPHKKQKNKKKTIIIVIIPSILCLTTYFLSSRVPRIIQFSFLKYSVKTKNMLSI